MILVMLLDPLLVFSPRYRQVIPAQDVVIEDVAEDEEKEDEDDGGNLRNRALPDVR